MTMARSNLDLQSQDPHTDLSHTTCRTSQTISGSRILRLYLSKEKVCHKLYFHLLGVAGIGNVLREIAMSISTWFCLTCHSRMITKSQTSLFGRSSILHLHNGILLVGEMEINRWSRQG